MLRNYFVVAARNLLKHKFYSIINILGLSIGLTCFMLISLYVLDELSYDKHFENAQNIHRIDFAAVLNGSDHVSSNVGAPTAMALKNDYPEVMDATRLNNTGNWFIKRKGETNTFKEENVLMADSNFFEFFSVEPIYGDPKTALVRPNTLALDLTTAKKIFGDINPVGEVLVLDNRTDYEVTAVYPDLPKNTHFHHNIMLSMSSFEWTNNNNWLSTNFNTYVLLKDGSDPKALEAQFPGMIKKYCEPLIQKFLGMTFQEFLESGNALGYSLTAMEDIHLRSDKEDELEANGDIKYIYIFGAVALFILILACINFMNLATARSANRAKEVGVRKAMGALKSHLIKQFITESVVLCFMSFLLAYGITFLTLGFFNDLAAKELDYLQLLQPGYLLLVFSVMLVSGILAGSYPSFYLSAFRPVEVLKGKLSLGTKGGGVRSGLVVLQFSISIGMIICTGVVFSQLSYIQNKKLGFNKDQVLMVKDAWILRDQVEAYKTEANRNSKILSSTIASFSPTGGNSNSDLYFKNPTAAVDESLVVNEARIDYDYFETMGIEIVDGRMFSKDFPSDSSAVIINEAAVRKFGYDNPVGDLIYTYGGSQQDPQVISHRIVGVMDDFHFRSLRNSIDPLLFHLGRNSGLALFKVETDDLKGTIGHLRDTWEKFVPGQPFAYSFMDQEFNSLYENEQQIGEIFSVFAFLSICIACLGLYGLAAFTAEQRTKEIGIRKVLGASIMNIIGLLSKEFIRLVIISFILGGAVAYYFMSRWLGDFEYRTNINDPVLFILSGAIAVIIAWVTMSTQSYKAATVNPARSLKDE